MSIITVYNLADFEEKTDFQQDVYYTWETRNIGTHLPRIEITTKIYSIGKDEVSVIICERLQTVSVDDVRAASDLMRGMSEIVRARITLFEDEVGRLAERHNCRAIPGDLKPSPISRALSCMLSKEFETLEARVSRLETQELGEVDERLCRVEARVLPSISRKEIKNRVGVHE